MVFPLNKQVGLAPAHTVFSFKCKPEYFCRHTGKRGEEEGKCSSFNTKNSMKSLVRLLRAPLHSSPLPVCADQTSQVKAALTYDREKMPEELEVSSSLEQGQVVKSFLCCSGTVWQRCREDTCTSELLNPHCLDPSPPPSPS